MRILSIDGGGIRGILPAAVLALCEDRFCGGRPAGEFFDYIAGTSTGGIIALGLSVGIPAREILAIYMDHGSEIFPPRRLYRNRTIRKIQSTWHFLRNLDRYRYEREALRRTLLATFGDKLLGHADRRLVIPSFDEYNEVHLFKTPHHGDYRRDWKETMIDVALSTSAAPTFFSTYRNGDRHFADGGVWANNPVMTALVDAMACYEIDRRDIGILSLGCVESDFGFSQQQMTKGGIWHWKQIISSAMRLQSQNALGQAGLLIGRDRLLRVDGDPMPDAIELDDYCRAASELPVLARRLVDMNAVQLADFFAVSRPPFKACHGPRHAQ
ncbi:patatin-like phospholipase family protein [Rhizobium sp. NTR19]|uniref:Patatin-like phospholipase family protein n=1 Tax=Neorhizobium turbinariae TaxID=2937795 RepID=A0ABT0ISM8_9HYPH|nr:CBASS cGAMP-activated phospholipase [Neorhizobium turbinariae]MCK8780860.1 patatin-like phospholipase family protein [Neorhizobium turbinariae]